MDGHGNRVRWKAVGGKRWVESGGWNRWVEGGGRDLVEPRRRTENLRRHE